MGIDVDLKDLLQRSPPPPPTHVSLEGPELPSDSKRTRRHHRTNLLSGWHKGKVRGQISATTWKCFLMVMSSHTCLHPSRRNAGPRRVTVVRCESRGAPTLTQTLRRGGSGIRPRWSPEAPRRNSGALQGSPELLDWFSRLLWKCSLNKREKQRKNTYLQIYLKIYVF